MKENVSITLKCPKCGGTKIELPDDYTDDSNATCANPDCDAQFGRWGDIKAKAMKKAASAVKDDLRKGLAKALRGNKNIKFKPGR